MRQPTHYKIGCGNAQEACGHKEIGSAEAVEGYVAVRLTMNDHATIRGALTLKQPAALRPLFRDAE